MFNPLFRFYSKVHCNENEVNSFTQRDLVRLSAKCCLKRETEFGASFLHNRSAFLPKGFELKVAINKKKTVEVIAESKVQHQPYRFENLEIRCNFIKGKDEFKTVSSKPTQLVSSVSLKTSQDLSNGPITVCRSYSRLFPSKFVHIKAELSWKFISDDAYNKIVKWFSATSHSYVKTLLQNSRPKFSKITLSWEQIDSSNDAVGFPPIFKIYSKTLDSPRFPQISKILGIFSHDSAFLANENGELIQHPSSFFFIHKLTHLRDGQYLVIADLDFNAVLLRRYFVEFDFEATIFQCELEMADKKALKVHSGQIFVASYDRNDDLLILKGESDAWRYVDSVKVSSRFVRSYTQLNEYGGNRKELCGLSDCSKIKVFVIPNKLKFDKIIFFLKDKSRWFDINSSDIYAVGQISNDDGFLPKMINYWILRPAKEGVIGAGAPYLFIYLIIYLFIYQYAKPC